MGWIVRLNGKGRVVIPIEIREKLGIKKGDNLMLDVREDEITLTILSGKKAENSRAIHLKSFLER